MYKNILDIHIMMETTIKNIPGQNDPRTLVNFLASVVVKDYDLDVFVGLDVDPFRIVTSGLGVRVDTNDLGMHAYANKIIWPSQGLNFMSHR